MGARRECREDRAPGTGASAGAGARKGQDEAGERTGCAVGPLVGSPEGTSAFPWGSLGRPAQPSCGGRGCRPGIPKSLLLCQD